MVKATCESCGASHQFDDAEVPPSGKVVKCTCGAPLTVMHATAAEMGFRVPTHATTAGLGAPRPPGSGKPSLAGGPSLAAFDDGDIGLDLGDLEDLSFVGGGSALAEVAAPPRRSPLAEATAEPRKTRSALADALAAADQAAKASPHVHTLPKIPPIPKLRPGAGITDLPAPKRPSGAGITDLPAPKRPGGAGITDLPTPKRPSAPGITDLPAPKRPGGAGITDLPTPKRPSVPGITDLPAPKRPGGAGITDLPAPKRPSEHGTADLPTSKRSAGDAAGFLDLPTKPPIRPPAATEMGFGDQKMPGIIDLPAPVGPVPTGNLMTPVGPSPTKHTDLPTPVGPVPTGNLMTPVGPTPTKSTDLTPVGPTPTRNTDLTPVGPTPTKHTDLPAPKGFFDDLPEPTTTPSPQSAPMGFFDDLAPPATTPPASAPRGFFDDLPEPDAGPPAAAAPLPAFDLAGSLDLDDLDLAPPSPEKFAPPPAAADLVPPLDLGAPSASNKAFDLAEPLDLGGGDSSSIPALELPDDQRDGIGTDRFGELDLPSAEPPSASVVSFSTPSTSKSPAKPSGAKRFGAPSSAFKDDSLELDAEAAADAKASMVGTTVENRQPTTDGDAASGGKGKSKPRKKAGLEFALSRRQGIILVAIVVILALGAGGFWFYRKHQASEEKRQLIQATLKNAQRSMQSDKPLHWGSALEAAESVLKRDPKNDDALGIAAQAYFAALIDEGTDTEPRQKAGRDMIRRINSSSAQGLEVDKAEALREIVEGQPSQAIKSLLQLQRKAAKDPDVALYLGWAYTATHDHKNAIATYNKALALAPHRIPAQYGLARAQLALGNIKEARDAFKNTFERDKQYKDLKGHIDHLGALIGYYQVKEVARFTERENLFLEVTKHKDADHADPRAVSLAWSLAGDSALRAGRVDEAKQRFDRALELSPANLNARVGQARADVVQSRIADARRRLTEILEIDPSQLDATLALAEVAVLEGKIEEAQSLVDVILTRQPPLDNAADLARAHMVQGAIYGADPGNLKGSIAEYEKAVALVSPDDDVRPTLALANALTHHPDDPAERERGTALLGPLESKATNDPALATTLGLAWLNAGKADRAEKWFRTALELKPNEVETLFQLGLALYQQGRAGEAIASIAQAHQADESREDVGLRLAIIYEEQKRDADAEQIYQKLLELKTPSLNVRSRAGRFYARRGNLAEVRTQGDAILAEKPKHPAGLFLRGEALASEKDYEAAVRFYHDAVGQSAEPQYLDGLGRALEQVSALDDALTAFRQAADAVPDYLSPRLGIARIRMARREFVKGVEALMDAQRLDPKNPWIYFQLGECYRETNEVTQSIPFYRKSIALDNTNDQVYYKLARAYYDLDRTAETAAALSRATQLFENKRRALAKTQPDYDEDWVTEGYRILGYAERARGNKSGAIRAFEAYLDRHPEDRAEIDDVQRLLMRLRAR